MTSGPAHPADQHAYTVRRAPRLSAVLAVAAVLGILAALVATTAIHASPTPPADPYSGIPLSFADTFGFVSLISLLGAGVLGLLVWLLLDRRSRATTRTVVLERTDDPAAADVRLDRSAADALRSRTAPTERTPEQ
ncbi:hypothetical protein ACIPJU_02395 [Micrococcus endophyticus]|uniref:Putative small integral membrane protein n=1 Tax=Micrococcus endophyticus TaxID=455343 RepID=A0A7W9MZ95_9MICC|nr:hypothetical protein [Micrococcus endophyticus]MBB5847453.1 putative small integral membrane protein [Micrococcus endophyticus]